MEDERTVVDPPAAQGRRWVVYAVAGTIIVVIGVAAVLVERANDGLRTRSGETVAAWLEGESSSMMGPAESQERVARIAAEPVPMDSAGSHEQVRAAAERGMPAMAAAAPSERAAAGSSGEAPMVGADRGAGAPTINAGDAHGGGERSTGKQRGAATHRSPGPRVVSSAKVAARADRPEGIDADEGYKAGLLAWVEGDTKAALAAYRRVLQARPRHAAAWRGAGLAYERLGERGAARAAFQKYLSLAPDAADVAEIRARMEPP